MLVRQCNLSFLSLFGPSKLIGSIENKINYSDAKTNSYNSSFPIAQYKGKGEHTKLIVLMKDELGKKASLSIYFFFVFDGEKGTYIQLVMMVS